MIVSRGSRSGRRLGSLWLVSVAAGRSGLVQVDHRVRRLTTLLLIGLTGLSAIAVRGRAEPTAMIYSHASPESDSDSRTQFAWDLLRMALERTRAVYGDYRIVTSPIAEPQRRFQRGADKDRQAINISLLPVATTPPLHLTAVHIPVYGGLWGYRVMLIRPGEQARFDKVSSLAELRSLTIGQAEFWTDVEILRRSGLVVVTGNSYDGLFKMLQNSRFDAFSRSVIEVIDEQRTHNDLAIEQHLLLHYPMPEYFWFPDDSVGRRLADRVRNGLQSMVADGSLQQSIKKHFAPIAHQLNLTHRQVIEIPNPLLTDENRVSDPALWYKLDGD